MREMMIELFYYFTIRTYKCIITYYDLFTMHRALKVELYEQIGKLHKA